MKWQSQDGDCFYKRYKTTRVNDYSACIYVVGNNIEGIVTRTKGKEVDMIYRGVEKFNEIGRKEVKREQRRLERILTKNGKDSGIL